MMSMQLLKTQQGKCVTLNENLTGTYIKDFETNNEFNHNDGLESNILGQFT